MATEKKKADRSGTGPRRGKGRPSNSQNTVGRDHILELTAEFLRHHPLSELTTAGIAKAAGVDPALVRYYFGSKDGLLTELIAQLTAKRSTAGLRFLSDTGPTQEKFRRRVKALLQANAEHPFYHDLLIARIFNRDDPAAKAILDDLAQRGVKLANKLMDDGQASGDTRRVDPAFFHMLLVGACSFYVSGRALLDAARQRKSTERTMDAYADFVVDILMQGLRPR